MSGGGRVRVGGEDENEDEDGEGCSGGMGWDGHFCGFFFFFFLLW